MYDDGDVYLEGINDQWERQRVVLRPIYEDQDAFKPDGEAYMPAMYFGCWWRDFSAGDALNEDYIPWDVDALTAALNELRSRFPRTWEDVTERYLRIFHGVTDARVRQVELDRSSWGALVWGFDDRWSDMTGFDTLEPAMDDEADDFLGWLRGEVQELVLETWHGDEYGWQYDDDGGHITVYGYVDPDLLETWAEHVGGGLITDPDLMAVAQQ